MFWVLPRATLWVGLTVIALNYILVQSSVEQAIQRPLAVFLLALACVPAVYSERWRFLLVTLVVMAACWYHFVEAVQQRACTSLLNFYQDGEISFIGSVVETGMTGAGVRRRIIVEVKDFIDPPRSENRGRLLLLVPAETAVAAGDYIIARGEVLRPIPPKFPWDFSTKNYLERFGAVGRFKFAEVGGLQVVTIKQTPQFLDQMRDTIMRTHQQALGARYGDLLTSMVIGNRNVVLDESITSSFRNLGLSHMVAASGFNLSIVVGTTWTLLRGFIRNRLALNVCATAMMVLYSELAGISASIERAMIMCVAMLFTNSFRRCTYLPSTLAVTLSITLWLDPFALSDVGLQLSYFATASLVCTSPALQKINNLFRNGAIRYTLETCLSCLSAVMSVLPLQLYYFWQTGLLQLPANAVVSPMVPIITIQGFATSTLACLGMSWLAGFLDQLGGLLLRILMFVVDSFNSFKWSVISTGPPEIGIVVLYYGNLLLLFTCKQLSLRFIVGLLGLMVSSLALFYRSPLPPLTMVRAKAGVVVIDSDRHALVIGDENSLQVKRCVSYHGATATIAKNHPSGFTPWFKWVTQGKEVLITPTGSNQQLEFDSDVSRNVFSSTVFVWDGESFSEQMPKRHSFSRRFADN